MSDEQLIPGRGYWLKLATQTVSATVAAAEVRGRTSTRWSTSRPRRSSSTRSACAEVTTDKPIVFEPYADSRAARRLHPDRQADQRHRRRGHDPLLPAPRAERPLAGARGRPRGARRAQGPEAGGAVVHRPVGLGQVDHRQPGREEAPRAWAGTPSCSTATMSATGSTRTSASPRPTGSRTSAASARSPS